MPTAVEVLGTKVQYPEAVQIIDMIYELCWLLRGRHY